MTEPRRFTLPVTGGEIAGLEWGDRERPIDVIFLHATGFNALTYRQSLEPLASQLRIVALDQRGHGRTRLPLDPAPLRAWTPFADDLAAAIEALELTRPVVLSGHSMGGTVSILTAAKLGPRVKGLVLFDPVIMQAPPNWATESPLVLGARRRRRDFDSKAAALEAYLDRGAFKTWPRQAVADYVEDGFREAAEGVTLTCPPEWEAAIFSVSTVRDPVAPLSELSPVHILRAEHHSTCRIDGGEPWPGRKVETIPGSNHFLPIVRPDVVGQALIEAGG